MGKRWVKNEITGLQKTALMHALAGPEEEEGEGEEQASEQAGAAKKGNGKAAEKGVAPAARALLVSVAGTGALQLGCRGPDRVGLQAHIVRERLFHAVGAANRQRQLAADPSSNTVRKASLLRWLRSFVWEKGVLGRCQGSQC